MHMKLLPFLGLVSLALTAPQTSQDALLVATKFSPPTGTTSAVVADANGNTRIFSQASNGSIILVSGTGRNTGVNYRASEAIVAGTAKLNTPIAVASPGNSLAQIRLYFIGTDDKVKEYIYTQSTNKWTVGGLTAQGYGTYPGSKVLFVVIDSNQQSRVGFVKTENSLTEAYDSDSGPTLGWHFVDY